MLNLFHQISMDNDYLGPRRIEALKKEDTDWQKKAQEAVLNIQEFTVKYFEITARAQKGNTPSLLLIVSCQTPQSRDFVASYESHSANGVFGNEAFQADTQ